MQLSFKQFSQYIHATTRSEGDVLFSGVSIDSRTVEKGDVFIALSGENFDGHDFVEDVVARGAVALVLERDVKSVLPALFVKDSRWVLGRLAQYIREKFTGVVIGITGSNGKTTVKELVAHILRENYRVLSTRGNLNNAIGVPLTLAGLMKRNYDIAVIEMGTNHPGEIACLTEIVQPDIATVTNIGYAHVEGLGSKEGVLKEKAQIFQGLHKQSRHAKYAVMCQDSSYYPYLKEHCGDRSVIGFGQAKGAAVRLKSIEPVNDEPDRLLWRYFSIDIQGREWAIQTRLPGKHSVWNIQAAIATALPLLKDMGGAVKSLAEFAGIPGRLQFEEGIAGCLLINDSYNANIDSLKAAIDVLAEFPGRKVLILGDMQELGNQAEAQHKEAGQYALLQGVDRLLGCGTLVAKACDAFGALSQCFDTQQQVATYILQELNPDPGTVFLIKGSRSSRMELVVDMLREDSVCC